MSLRAVLSASLFRSLPTAVRRRGAPKTWTRTCGTKSIVAGSKSEVRKAAKKNYLAVTPDRRDEREFASLLSQDDYNFLCDTVIYEKSQLKEKAKSQTTNKAKRVDLWSYLQTYRSRGYAEKYLLMDPGLASRIGDAIVENSDALRGGDGDASTPATFIDTDGGFCHVAKRVLEHEGPEGGRAFDKVKVYFRDYNFSLLHSRAMEEALRGHGPDRLEFRDVNLSTMVSDVFLPEFVSPLAKELAVSGRHEWSASRPPFTIFGTVTDGFVKYLTYRLFERDSVHCEYHWCRPEFFFIVSHRSVWHMTSCQTKATAKVRPRPFDRFFQMVFDTTLVDKLPISSFFPWKESKRRQKVHRPEEDFLYLVKVRPKAETGVSPNASLQELFYYCNVLFRNPKTTRVIPQAEKWLPGVGADMVRAGFDVYDTPYYLSEADVLKTFNILADQPGFRQSAFPEQAVNSLEKKAEFQRNNSKRVDAAVDETLINLRRKSGVSRKSR